MQGTPKIEVKFVSEGNEREYNFFFPHNAPAQELVEVCKKMVEEFEGIKTTLEEKSKEETSSQEGEIKDGE